MSGILRLLLNAEIAGEMERMFGDFAGEIPLPHVMKLAKNCVGTKEGDQKDQDQDRDYISS